MRDHWIWTNCQRIQPKDRLDIKTKAFLPNRQQRKTDHRRRMTPLSLLSIVRHHRHLGHEDPGCSIEFGQNVREYSKRDIWMWKHEHSYRAPEKGFLLVTLIHAMISWHNTVLPYPPFFTSCWSRWWMFHRYVFHGYTFAPSPFCNRWRTFHRLGKLSENIISG